METNYLWSDFVNDTVREKRSDIPPGGKRQMTVEIFTVIDYSIFDRQVAYLKIRIIIIVVIIRAERLKRPFVIN